jgi:putative ABC transport system ATP-binding protein
MQNVRLSLELHEAFQKQDMNAIACDMLGRLGMKERVNYYPANLSGGQRQRVAIARALVSKPKIVLADEPTASLDKESAREVVELMQELAQSQGTTTIMVTHDNKILDVANRIIIVDEGKLAGKEQEEEFVRKMKG